MPGRLWTYKVGSRLDSQAIIKSQVGPKGEIANIIILPDKLEAFLNKLRKKK